MDPDATYDRERGRDIVSRALVVANAVRVDPSEWLQMNDDDATATSLVGRDFGVYELPRRNARQHPNAMGQRGARLGPLANGAMSQALKDPKWIPPAARRVSPRELLTFLKIPDQVGYPGAINTDGCLGSSVVAYQSWKILLGRRGAAPFNLVRLLRGKGP